MSLDNLKKRLFKNPEVKAEYDKLGTEFALINTLITMRKEAGLTQEQVASLMGTQKSNISRLEHGETNPQLSTLQKYAKACGCELTVGFKPIQ